MSNPMIQVGHEVREMTDDEFAQWQQDRVELESALSEQAAAKQAILDRLGLTAEEARLLLS